MKGKQMTDNTKVIEACRAIRGIAETCGFKKSIDEHVSTILSATAALTAPAEPVAYLIGVPNNYYSGCYGGHKVARDGDFWQIDGKVFKAFPVYTSPPSDAARIEELEAEKRELLDALVPFASAADGFIEAIKGTLIAFTQGDGEERFEYSLVPADFANAAALHAKLKGDK